MALSPFGPSSWWDPLAYTYGPTFGSQYEDPIIGDPLSSPLGVNSGLGLCEDPDGNPCGWSWPPEAADGGIDWVGVLSQAWEFLSEVYRTIQDDETTDEDRQRQVDLAQSGAVTSGWMIGLAIAAAGAVALLLLRE